MEKSEIQEGQSVMVQWGHHVNTGTVVTVARVWITVQVGDQRGRLLRFRLDTQDDGSDYVRAHFYTMEQWAAQEARVVAIKFLREQGITVYYSSPWYERAAELASILKAAGLS